MADEKAILVIGDGDATGGAIAKRFAKEGYIACITRRTVDKLQPLVDEIRVRRLRGAPLSLRRAQGRRHDLAGAADREGHRADRLDDEMELRHRMETF